MGISAKLESVWRLLRSDGYMLFTNKGYDPVDVMGYGVGDLKQMLSLSIKLKQAYNDMLELSTQAATEAGELHTLNELKKAIEDLE